MSDAVQETQPNNERTSFWSLDTIHSPLGWALAVFIIVFGLWHIATVVYLTESDRWQNTIHFAGFAFLAIISRSAFGARSLERWAILTDLALGLLIAGSALWLAWLENPLYARDLAALGQPHQFYAIDWIAGLVVIFAAVELTRRLTGWIIPILVIISLAYILFLGQYLPGVFRAASLPLDDVLFRSLYNDEGMFGIIASISSNNIALFMIFGGFLVVSGASDFVIELSKLIAGRFRGGAAFVAVISSALTGTISGSAIANTASTGVITIPLMKANGFRAKFAAGVETAASTGGQMMPPIMGAGAFVMVAYTQIPYGEIVMWSVVPAILYFMSVAFMVRIEAVKYQIGEDKPTPVDRKKLIAGALNFVLPLGVMMFLLVSGVTPSFAACYAIATLCLVSWLTPNRMGPRRIAQALLLGIRTAMMTAVLLVCVGLINNAITTSGLGNGFSLMIAQWSQGSLVLAILLIGLASLVLGMGLPVTAAYIILAILSAPALAGMLADQVILQQLIAGGIDPAKGAFFMMVDHPMAMNVMTSTAMSPADAAALMAAMPFELAVTLRPALVDPTLMTLFLLKAHLIVFWLSQDSNVTPPVALAAFTAAGIAKSPPMATGVEAWKIAKGLYIVPLMFAYTPLVGGEWWEVAQLAVFALFGIYAFTSLLQLYAEGPLSWWHYPLLLIGLVGCFWPLELTYNVIGAIAVALVVWLSARRRLRPSLR